MDYVELMNFKRSIEMKNYIRSLKSFIRKVETNSVSECDKSNAWYSSYIDCTKIMFAGRRRLALNSLIAQMKFDLKASQIRLANYEKNGNFAGHPRDAGFNEVKVSIRRAYEEIIGV